MKGPGRFPKWHAPFIPSEIGKEEGGEYTSASMTARKKRYLDKRIYDLDLLEAARKGDIEEAQRAVECGATWTCAFQDGKTPLHVAVWHGHAAMVQFLVKEGGLAAVKAKDCDGMTPLQYAAIRDHNEILEWLMYHSPAGIHVPGLAVRPLLEE